MTNTQTLHRLYSASSTAFPRAILIATTCLVVACGGSRSDTGSENDPNTGDGGNRTGDGAVATGDGRGDGGGGTSDAGGNAGDDAGACQTACAGDDCGQVPDGCGGFLSCSQCGQGLTCGQNAPNKCGAPPPITCTPKQAADVCPGKCGAVSDGCSRAQRASTRWSRAPRARVPRRITPADKTATAAAESSTAALAARACSASSRPPATRVSRFRRPPA